MTKKKKNKICHVGRIEYMKKKREMTEKMKKKEIFNFCILKERKKFVQFLL